MSYTILKHLAQWFSRATEALIVATSTVEDSIVHGIAKIENAAWDVEQRMHDQAVSAAHQLANKEHEAIQQAHDAALAALTRARRVYDESYRTIDAKRDAVDTRLQQALDLHLGG